MALAYFGVKISDSGNWVETPEGYVVFKNCVIARTGFQTYKGSELDKDELAAQGVVVEPSADVELYRDADEVFAPATIASFELKSVTDGHPKQLLNVDTVSEHEEGQITNVRKGSEPLDSGDLPLLADLIVKSRNLIAKIKGGLRELSCGYNYHVLKAGNLLKQVDIVGNHVAIVNVGRAGHEAAIGDSGITATETNEGRDFMSKFLDTLLNRNRPNERTAKIAAWAKDAKPEDVTAAIDAMASELEKKEESKPAAHDAACDCATCKGAKDEKPAADKAAVDRKRFHDALDKVLDGKEEEMNAADADMEELKSMFSGAGKDEGIEADKPAEKTEATDADVLVIEPGDRVKPLGEGTDVALDEAYKAGAKAVLKALRPTIAASKDKKIIGAFDTAAKIVTAKATGGTPGYAAAAAAAEKRGAAATDSMVKGEAAVIKEAEDLYSKRRTARQ